MLNIEDIYKRSRSIKNRKRDDLMYKGWLLAVIAIGVGVDQNQELVEKLEIAEISLDDVARVMQKIKGLIKEA